MSNDCSYQLDQFNELVAQASNVLSCGSECQKQKQADQLQQVYYNSQANLATCSSQAEESQKNYIIFTQGQSAYNEYNNNQLQKKAQIISEQFTQNFNNEVVLTQSQINTYNGILINFRNIVDLYKQYKEENIELFKDLKDETNDVLTNERKTYYEDQNIDNLKFYYYYFLLTVYIVCGICFIVFYFIYPSNTNWTKMIGIIILFVALPFISSWILATVIYLLYKAYNLLPKNVYAQKNY
jgi:hypothetical protein